MTTADLQELAGLYAEETGLPHVVCLALVKAGREPTRRMFERVTRIGYTAAEVALFNGLLSSPDTES